jgi:hypothetical protein
MSWRPAQACGAENFLQKLHAAGTARLHAVAILRAFMSARTFANYVSNFLLLVVSLVLLSIAAWSSLR